MNLIKGQDIVILIYAGIDYIQIVPDSFPWYHLQPEDIGVNPKETLWTVKEDEVCEVETQYIQDGNDVPYYRINGPRPRNIVKR